MDPCIDGELYYLEGSQILRKFPGGQPRVFAKNVPGVNLLIANNTGSLLACVTASSVLIYDVSDASCVSMITVESKTAKWHPLSVDVNACILVLTRKGQIIAYDLSNLDQPQAEVLVPPPNSHHATASAADTSIELDYGLYEPVDFCFGPLDTPTGPMSLYITSSDGDLYGVCPILPERFTITEAALARLLDEIVRYKDQVSAMTYIGELTKHVQSSAGGANLILIDRPSRIAPPAIQGPFRLEPFPESMYSEESFSLMSCSIGPSLAPMTLLAHATSKHVIFYLSDESLGLQWDTSSSEPPDFVVVAAVPLSSADEQRVLVQLTQEFAFVRESTSGSVIVIDIRPWCEQILDSLVAESVLPDKLASSNVSKLPPSRVWAPNFTSKIGGDGQVKAWGEDSPDVSNSLAQLKLEPTLLNGHPFLDKGKIDSLVAQVDKAANATEHLKMSSGAPIEADYGSLVQLTKVSDAFEEQLAHIYTATSSLSVHKSTQQRELRLQLRRIAEIRARVDESKGSGSGPSSGSQSQLEAALSRQERIRERINALSANVLAQKERGTPPGTKERAWYKEIKRTDAKAAAISDRAAKIAVDVSIAASSRSQSESGSDVLDNPQLRQLRRAVNAQGEQLAELVKSARAALEEQGVQSV